MKRYTAVVLPIISLIFASCAFSTHDMISNSNTKTVSLSEENLNSKYSLTITGEDTKTLSLWYFIHLNTSNEALTKNVDNRTNKYVKIGFENNHTMNAYLYEGNELLDKITLNGKVSGNYFLVERKYRLIPFPPIWGVRNEVRSIIAISESGDLVVIQGVANQGWGLLILVGGHSHVSEYIFQKLD